MSKKKILIWGAAVVLTGAITAIGSFTMGRSHRVANAQATSLGLNIATKLKNLPKATPVAYVNGHPITARDVARRAAFIDLSYELNNRPPIVESNNQAVVNMAHTLALYQSAKASGIKVSKNQALSFAKQQWQMLTTHRQLESKAHDYQKLFKDLGISPNAYLERYAVPAAQEMLTISAMDQKIALRVSRGSLTVAQWHRAQGLAIKSWQTHVWKKMTLKIVQSGY